MNKIGVLFLTASLTAISCARGTDSGVATNTLGPSGIEGSVSSKADGDVKTGTGALEFFNVRMDRQDATTGASIFRQYANPNQTYNIQPGERIELWVEYRGANNPRLQIDWGNGEIDRFDGQRCGSCLLRHTYPRQGLWTVVVTLDDGQGTTVTRTFALNSIVDQPVATLNLGFAGSSSCGETARLTGPGGINCERSGGVTSGACSANFPAGTTVTINFDVTYGLLIPVAPRSLAYCTGFSAWVGACSGVGTGAGNSGSCTLTLPAGVTATTLQLTNFD